VIRHRMLGSRIAAVSVQAAGIEDLELGHRRACFVVHRTYILTSSEEDVGHRICKLLQVPSVANGKPANVETLVPGRPSKRSTTFARVAC
jgi:hypothetical protein